MRAKTHLKVSIVMSVFLMAMACTAAGDVIYVDDDASLGGNGQSWGTAYRYLQDALGIALSGDEIRVAQGIYTPDSNSANPNGSGDREATFQLKNGVAVKGGYAGFGEPDPNALDIKVYETILSGDLNGDDGVNFANNGENSYHVVSTESSNSATIVDGFTITGGNANGTFMREDGGGIKNVRGDLTIRNCTIRGNSTTGDGGGMINTSYANPTLINCIFSGNSAGRWGGGMHEGRNCRPKLINCTFNGNSAGNGGAISIRNFNTSYTTIVTNCILWGNSPNEVYIYDSSLAVNYSNVQGGWSGTGNINEDPLFLDADGEDNLYGTADDNLQLAAGSGCIDAGDNTDVPADILTDLAGNPRFYDAPYG